MFTGFSNLACVSLSGERTSYGIAAGELNCSEGFGVICGVAGLLWVGLSQ